MTGPAQQEKLLMKDLPKKLMFSFGHSRITPPVFQIIYSLLITRSLGGPQLLVYGQAQVVTKAKLFKCF